MADQYRRALLAFPDEDVLLGTRLLDPEGFRAFNGLQDVVPFPGHKSSGEERAWARRLSKRFGCESRLDDRTFVLKGDGSVAGGLDFFAPKVKIPEGVETHFEQLQGRPGRPPGRLRLGHGRGPGRGQARPLSRPRHRRRRAEAAVPAVNPGAARRRTPCSSGRPAAG